MIGLDADTTRRPPHRSKPSTRTIILHQLKCYRRSDDYAKNLGYATTSNYKTMLLNLVAVGKAFKTYDDMDDLTSPPAGYDSVRTIPPSSSSYLFLTSQHWPGMSARSSVRSGER